MASAEVREHLARLAEEARRLRAAVDPSPMTGDPGALPPTDSVCLPNSAGDGRHSETISPAEKSNHVEPCTVPYTVPVSDDNRGLSGKDASFMGDINNASDRANQDRYLAGEFRGMGVQSAEHATQAQKDRNDDTRWACGEFGSVKAEICGVKSDICGLGKEGASHAFGIVTAVERNGRSAELATEKTSAATILAIEKTAAAAALAAAVNTAALQKEIAEICCCVREDGEKTRALVSQIDRERLQARLATLEARLPLAATA